jgi:hypothetical protein
MLLSLAAAAFAEGPRVVVALGDGIVVSPTAHEAVPGGIAAVLADCLEERSPKRFSVVDRSVAGETLASARPKVTEIVGLGPAWVVVTLGARELADPSVDPAKLAADVAQLAGELGSGPARTVLLVGALPAAADGDGAALESRVAAFNAKLQALSAPGLVSLEPGRGKRPKEGLVEANRLSAAGQARVAAAICDVVLSSP